MPPYRSATEVEVTPTSIKVKGGIVGVIFILVIIFGFWWMQKHEDLVPVQAANDSLKYRLAEATKHMGEDLQNTSILYDGELGLLVTGIYRDRCIALIAKRPNGDVLLSTLLADMLKDEDKHALIQMLMPTLHAAAVDSKCDYVNHGTLARQPYEIGRQGYNVRLRYDFVDGCAFAQWVDTYHGMSGPREWIVCRHY